MRNWMLDASLQEVNWILDASLREVNWILDFGNGLCDKCVILN